MPPAFDAQLSDFVRALTDSYRHYLGMSLGFAAGDATDASDSPILRCWHANAVIVAHDGASDPVMVFGNRVALSLWEMTWDEFRGTPSRYTAEADMRDERQTMLAKANRDGFYRGYEGVRISARGRRFRIEDAVIWNVLDGAGVKIGQAATFDRWTML